MKVTAHAVRSGDWWSVDVPEVDGLFTQARRLDQIPAMVADAGELLTDIPAAEFEVTLDYDFDPAARREIEEVKQEKTRIEEDILGLMEAQERVAVEL